MQKMKDQKTALSLCVNIEKSIGWENMGKYFCLISTWQSTSNGLLSVSVGLYHVMFV